MRNPHGSGGSSSSEFSPLVTFDLSSIPAGSTITSATLHLYYFGYGDNNPAGHDLQCYRVTESWDESAVTWNSRPGREVTPTAVSTVPSSPGQWISWDVTLDVRSFVRLTDPLPNNGWRIQYKTFWGDHGIPYPKFRSKEHGSKKPYLTVSYTPP